MSQCLTGLRNILFLLGCTFSLVSQAQQTAPDTAMQDLTCPTGGCFISLDLPKKAGKLHYYASAQPDKNFHPQSALVVLHGHPRDADRSFAAGQDAVRSAGQTDRILVIAPLFQVGTDQAGHCHSKNVPTAQPEDTLWTCGGWLNGALSVNSAPISSFAALDALLVDLSKNWPSLHTITIAGFSAGGQLLQRYIGFAAAPPAGLHLRYVIADPGSWLYFDPVRPSLRAADGSNATAESCGKADFPAGCHLEFVRPATAATCPEYDQWKYGLRNLPDHLQTMGKKARQRYKAADIHYLEAEQDSSTRRGAFYKILDKSCSAMLQGPFRLQRGVAYAAYDREYLGTDGAHTMTLVPDCGHRVTCVFAKPQAQKVLFDQ